MFFVFVVRCALCVVRWLWLFVVVVYRSLLVVGCGCLAYVDCCLAFDV